MTHFIFGLGQGVRGGVVFSLPVIVWAYKGWRRLKQKILGFIQPAERRVFYLLANRHLMHLLIAVIVIIVATDAVRASTQTAAPFGESTLLFQAFKDEETVFDDADLPQLLEPDELDFFLDLPIEELEPELPVALQDQALTKIDVSPVGLPTTRTKTEEYLVLPGDTISSIADKFGISINTILWENKLGPYSIIRPSDKLVILPTTGVSHKIKKGDTLERLAKLYGVTTEEIKQFNNLATDSTLAPEQILIVPGGVPYAPTQPKVVKKPTVVVQPDLRPAPAGPGMLWPTTVRRISQYFSWRHPGIDIAGPTGTPIYAADDGVITLIEKKRTGYGWQIMIDHGNGFKTRYAHNSKILVSLGQRVSKGGVIAMMGSTGRSTGSHLHFEIYAFGRRINPFNYVKR